MDDQGRGRHGCGSYRRGYMNVYVALVRGINVGGKRRLPMKEFVSVLEELGAREVKTYIQSGNAVFLSESDPARLAAKIGREINQRHGFEPHVLVLKSEDLEAAIAGNPFPEAENDPKSLHLGFLDAAPKESDSAELQGLAKNSERFRLIDKVFYLHAPEGVGRSKLAANAERLLGVAMTDRNWRTVRKLQEMANEAGDGAE